jgi:tRNA nucleotidyltransferase (CCA-adding enzyme)
MVEVTTFRTDGEYTDSRHPESVCFTSNIKEDLSRRDFTVNAMAYNKNRGIVDPFGGADDIEKKILRAVGDPLLRMQEDALRIMRALRFSAQIGFEIESETVVSLKEMKEGLKNVSGERLGTELTKLVCATYPKKPIELMCELGVSEYILGDQVPSERSLETLEELPSRMALRFGCLLWDCEKTKISSILGRMKYSNEQKRAILNVRDAKDFKSTESDADVRRFLLRYGKEADDAALLREKLLGDTSLSPQKIKRIREGGFCDGLSSLAIGGAELMEMGIRGKEIGQKLNLLLELVTEDPSLNTKEALTEYVIKNIKGI